jgi:hypothetical protein
MRSGRGSSIPTETVALYISQLAETHKPATIGRHLAAIASAHKAHGFTAPGINATRRRLRMWQGGIRRTHGTAQTHKSPLLVPDLRRIARNLPDKLIGIRDRTLLLVGFAGAFRRGELVES